MVVSGLILALYFWVFFAGPPVVSEVLFIDDRAAIAAGAAFVSAAVSYLWTPQRWLLAGILASYATLIVMVALLIVNTGGIASPFIALWMIVALFSPIFGWYGGVLVLATILAFVGWLWSSDELEVGTLITAGLVTIGPMLVGALGLRPSSAKEEAEDRSYHELASELSSVSGKAEVVIAAIADGVVALDTKGIVQLINPAAQKLIGWGKNDAIGLDYKSVLRLVDELDKELDPATDPVRQALETNKSTHTEAYSLLTADTNKKFLASLTASPVGSLGSGVIVVFRDITSEKAEEREQAEFISTASHEMRTPVASIEGYLGLALNPQTAQIDDKAREYIGKAQEAAKHLGRLFQDLLDVSRADDGRLSNNPRVVDVVPFLGDIVQGLMPKATEKQLHVNYKPDPDFTRGSGQGEERGERVLSQVLYVNVDNDHLREVLSNLIENAIKYTPVGNITIDAEGDDQHVTISIADSGIGIPKEDMAHLFQKFYRVDNTETREIGGTGLGLYLCRKLTEAMGGQIWADSQYQQGSTFYVRFPRVDHVEARQLIEQSEQATVTPPINQVHSIATETPLGPAPTQPSAPTPAPAVPTQAPAVPVTTPSPAQTQAAPQPQTVPPPPAPVAAVQPPQPVAPQPAPAPQPQPQPPSIARPNQAPLFVPGSRPNTPLSHIENNPRQYARPAQPPVKPPRQNQSS